MNFSARCLSLAVTLGLTACTNQAVWAQQPARAGCTLDFQDHFRCDREAFQKRLAAAHTAHVETDRLDLFAHRRTQALVEGLGKTVATPEQRPDLVFELAPIDRTGRLNLSPAAVALATLTVYDVSPGTGTRARIWVETLDGDADKPWPGVVADLLRKFQADALTR